MFLISALAVRARWDSRSRFVHDSSFSLCKNAEVWIINRISPIVNPMRELHLIAHDIRSLENVGALFRTCDSLGVAKLWLTGYTPSPPDPRISKVALGAEVSVVFEAVHDIGSLFDRLKGDGISVYALEITQNAYDLYDFQAPERLALLLGSERTGIPPSLLERCEGAMKIAQKGVKESLNVAVAAGIASWAILHPQHPCLPAGTAQTVSIRKL